MKGPAVGETAGPRQLDKGDANDTCYVDLPQVPPPRRCACRSCVAASLRTGLGWLIANRREIAADITLEAMADLHERDDPICPRGRAERAHWYRLGGREP